MTITVTTVEAGPFAATGASQQLPFAFKAITDAEVEVVAVVDDEETILDADDYAVDRNTNVDGTSAEGGTVTLTYASGAALYVRAAPLLTQGQVWSDTGGRLRNLNDALDRAHLGILRLKLDLARGVADFAASEAAVAALVTQAEAALASAEGAAGDAAATLAQVVAHWQDILALQATGDTAVAIATRADKAANGSDFADKEAVTGNLLFLQSGTGAVSRSLRSKMRDVVNAKDFGLTGSGDETSALQALIDACPGKTIELDDTYTVSSSVTVSGADTGLRFRNGAGISYSTATLKPIVVSGDNVTIEGMVVNAPATFDGTNEQPLYGCVWVTGDNCRLIGLTLNNVPKVGINFTECEGGLVSQCRIIGNFPTASFTGTEVGHAGILIDAGSTGRQGSFIIESNDITECVQGVLIANYGATSRSQSIVITGNTFHSVWNHGVYGAGINYGVVVTSNSFVFCQVPVAMSGYNHIVSDNSITTGGSSGTYTDQVGISLRDPINCVVANNTIQGETGTGQIVINLTTSLGTVVRGNIVQGNTLDITGAGSATMIAVGGTDATDLTDNIVKGNVCKGPGRTEIGLISMVGAAACPAYGSMVEGNSLLATSASHGVQLANLRGAAVSGNRTRWEHDAASVRQIGGVQFADCADCDIHDNAASMAATYGANFQLIGVWESTTGSGNRAWNNPLRNNSAKPVYGIPYFTVDGSGILVRDAGAGAPNLSAGVGSTWGRSDGGAGTSFYVKEVGSDASGWVGK